MKNYFTSLFLIVCSFQVLAQTVSEEIKINQVGYLTNEIKWAYVSDSIELGLTNWEVKDAITNSSVFQSSEFSNYIDDETSAEYVYKIDFTAFTTPGEYYVEVEGIGKSYSFVIHDTAYNNTFKALMKSFYYQRSGFNLTETYAGKWAKPAEYSNDAYVYHGFESDTIVYGEIVNSSGGWRDAGDPNKKVVPACVAIHHLLFLYEYFPEEISSATWNIPDDNDMGLPDFLKEVKFAIDWLFRMQREDGAVWHAVTQADFFLTGLGHLDPNLRYLMPVSTTATADFAAIMANAGRVFKQYDEIYADSCLKAAKQAWEAIQNESIWNNPNIKGADGSFLYPETHGYSVDPPGIKNTANYDDSQDSDEIQWAAAELYISTGDTAYKNYFDAHINTQMWYPPGWQSINMIANMVYMMACKDSVDATVETLNNSFKAYADVFYDKILTTGFGICLSTNDYYDGSNGLAGNFAYTFVIAYEIFGDEKYKQAALSLMNYLLGANSLNQTFISGIGKKTVEHIFHLPSRFDGVAEVVPGLVPAGPSNLPSEWDQVHQNLLKSNLPPAKCYVDSDQSWTTNECALVFNSPWVFVAGYFFKNVTISSTPFVKPNETCIYPNPTDQFINLYLHEVSDIYIYDIHGRLVMQRSGVSINQKIDISMCKKDLYLIKIKNGANTIVQKFLKQ